MRPRLRREGASAARAAWAAARAPPRRTPPATRGRLGRLIRAAPPAPARRRAPSPATPAPAGPAHGARPTTIEPRLGARPQRKEHGVRADRPKERDGDRSIGRSRMAGDPMCASTRNRDDGLMRTLAATTRPTTPHSSGRGGAPARRQATLLGRIVGWCFDHRIKAVGLWLVALFTIFGAAGAVGSQFSTSSSVPDSGSAAGFAVLEEHFPDLGTGGQSGTIVFQARARGRGPRGESGHGRAVPTRRRRLPRRRRRATASGRHRHLAVRRGRPGPDRPRRAARRPGRLRPGEPVRRRRRHRVGTPRVRRSAPTLPRSTASKCCRAASTSPWSSLRRRS